MTENDSRKQKKLPQWMIDAQEKINKGKLNRFKEKSDALMKSAIENISELLDLYFKNWEDGEDEENKNSYDVLNEAWKEYCKPIMATKSKYIKLDYLAFEKGVKETIESELFAEWLKLNKEAKEKAESQEPTLTVVQDEP
jgi:hypothetical protein